MSNSYVSNHVHVVFATKNRTKIIPEEVQPKLWAYMAGIAKNHGMHAVAIGGTADHAHALIDVGAALGIAKALQVLKANSSRWMNEHPRARFEWQEGYFACSVSRSLVPSVVRYIANQKEHHKKMDFAAEFALLLKKHGFESQDSQLRSPESEGRHKL
jgi:putative transposase